MRSGSKAVLGTGVLCLGLAASAALADRSPLAAQGAAPGAASARPAAPKPASQTPSAPAAPRPAITPMRASAPAAPNSSEHNAVVTKYCATCHNERRPAAGLSLASFDVSKAAEHPEIAERMIVKLQASMMPPPGMPRPEPAAHQRSSRARDHGRCAAKANPNPGGRTFQRLNRPEYARAIQRSARRRGRTPATGCRSTR